MTSHLHSSLWLFLVVTQYFVYLHIEMRRFTSLASRAVAPSAMTGSSSLLPRAGSRSFHSILSLVGSLITCSACVLCFASWGNNICNVRRYGRWRFRNTIDDVIMVSDFRMARYAGGLFGLLFWWFIVGPRKYLYSNLEQMPGNTRFGPF